MPRMVLWILIFLSIISVKVLSAELDLCNSDGNTTYVNYTSEVTETCGCVDNRTCLRKCCQIGYTLYHKEDSVYKIYESVCIKNQNPTVNFTVPIYLNDTKLYDENTFMIGMLGCNKGRLWNYFKFDNANPKEKYYVQENGTLFYPNSKKKFYANDKFCVDEDEGLSVYLCYTLKKDYTSLLREFNKTGRF